jgi:hypothetical protein
MTVILRNRKSDDYKTIQLPAPLPFAEMVAAIRSIEPNSRLWEFSESF